MTTKRSLMNANGLAWSIIALMERGDYEGQKVAKEQIQALADFYYDNKPNEEITQQEADELMDLDPRETPEEHMEEQA